MGNGKKSLCVFIHFSHSRNIPYGVLLFLKELSFHFDEILFVANKRAIRNEKDLSHRKIQTMFVKNEGYDLGMFYKAFHSIDPAGYHQIACINDSNILFNRLNTIFDWGKASRLDFWGLIDSYERPPFSTHAKDYHIQSHFIVFNEKAIALLPEYFKSIDMKTICKEHDILKLRHTVINQWEIGVSQFMIEKGMATGSYINSQLYAALYLSGKYSNISLHLYSHLIEAGYPLIKRKVIVDRQLKYIVRLMPTWRRLLQQYGKREWEIDRLVLEMNQIRDKSPKRTINKLKRHLQKIRFKPTVA